MTFYLWVRSLRADPRVKDGRRTFDSIYYGILAGFAYVYMAAAWGGFIFVINLIAFHAGALVLLGRYSSKLHTSYTLFFLVGTIGAMQIPVIGMRPLQSLEQISGLIVFLAFQVLEYVEQKRRANKLSIPQVFVERVKATLMVCIPLGLFTYYLFNIGHFGPLGARIRGLFVKHTRTGNPLVDSVAEHQPASAAAYRQYLHHIFDIVPYGFALAVCRIPMTTDANFFLVAYAGVAYYFANKMARLIILLGPISSALGGMALGFAADQLIVGALGSLLAPGLGIDEQLLEDSALKEAVQAEQKKGKKGVVAGVVGDGSWADKCTRVVRTSAVVKAVHNVYRNPIACLARVALGVYMVRSGGNVCTCHGVKCTDVPLFLFLSGFFSVLF
jgi:dolichyl-diphosphooligosaccharide--protein glycosyltransferase